VKYLLDTNAISEERKKARMSPIFRAWRDGVDEQDLCMSVLVVGEIRRGIESLRRRDTIQAAAIDGWFQKLQLVYAPRILPVDVPIADLWGRLQVPNPLPEVDGLLAATEIVHGLVLVTRNVNDVRATGCRCINPFEPAVGP
jgi:predicted nucleic acid-binding protein